MPNGPPQASALGSEHAWARFTVGGVGVLHGDVVDFDDKHVTVALEQSVSGVVGRGALLTLGVGPHQESGLWATVTRTAVTADGRSCLVLGLVDGKGGGRRNADRVPFAAKVDLLVVSGRTKGEPRVRGVAVDLSTRGIDVRLDRDIAPGTAVLVRFPVPPNRGGAIQVRGTVASCRPDPDGGVVHGVTFERMSGTVVQQLQAALRALTLGH